MKRKLLAAGIAAAALAAAGLFAYHFASGGRYRLYIDELAGDCWRVVELATLPMSTIEPVSVERATHQDEGGESVSIDYALDRAFGGATLNVTCTFAADGGLEAVEFQGNPLDPGALDDVARELGR